MRNSVHIETTPLEADVFIVGGGPAGLAAAIAARQKGFRVGIADSASRPFRNWANRRPSLNPAYRTFGILCAIAFSSPVQAQSVTLNLDPARTQITFTLRATFHTVEGSFKLKGGAIQFNPATGEARGDVVVDATSGESGNNSRDRKMHKSVLESENYPEIVFVPERVQGQVSLSGQSHVQIQG